ncbi:MAG: exo-alpha-sialidase [Chloroflexi bacterium]|nr:exo-alpha-sialidase [Chloroflexota bacterium]
MTIAKKRLPVFVLLIGLLVFLTGTISARASRSMAWSPDAKIPGYLEDTFTPFLVADRNKTVHAFASQWVENDGRRLAIVYRQWTLARGWTRPVDILLSPVGGNAIFLGAYLDSFDILHVIFSVTRSNATAVYYSYAPAINADWSLAWSPPTVIGWDALGLNSAAIAGDDKGNLVVIYSGNRDGNGVYFVHSRDSGRNWSGPLPVFLTYDTKLSAFSLRLAVSPDQRIRAAWNVVTNLGLDEALYFSSFDVETAKWETPLELERRINLADYFGPSYPALADNGREIVVIYNSGNPFSGRPVAAGRPIQRSRMSLDGGKTWNEPVNPFPFHVGRSGEHTLALDGNGTPHTLFIQRIETSDEKGTYRIIGGIWHSTFANGVWTNPDRFVTTIAPHDVRSVVVQGNVLLAVWRQDPGLGANGVWYSYSILDAPEKPVIPLATVPDDFYVATSIYAPNPKTPEPTLPPQPTPKPELLGEAPPSDLGKNPALPIIIGIIPVILILIGVVIGVRYFNNRQ